MPPLDFAVPDPITQQWIDPATGRLAPASMPSIQAPLTGTVPVIDVGTPAPGAQPGESGSQLRPVRIGPEAKSGAPLPAQAVTPPPAPSAAPGAEPPLTAGATVPAPAHVQAGLEQNQDGSWSLPPDAAPPVPGSGQMAPKDAPAAKKEAPQHMGPEHFGLVQGPNGDWMTPETAAAERAKGAAEPGQPTGGQPVPPSPGTPPQAPQQPPPGTPPAIPDQVAHQELRNTPQYQAVQDAMTYLNGLGVAARHGLTLGFDEMVMPVAGAIRRSVTEGVPFHEAYDQEAAQMRSDRHAYEQMFPEGTTAAEFAGGVAPALLGGGLYADAAKYGTPLATRAVQAARNVAADAVNGAIAGFGQTEGDVRTKLAGAWQSAKDAMMFGRAIAAGGKVVRSVTPTQRRVEQKAGEILTEAKGPSALPAPQQAPVHNFPLDAGSAYNDPALAQTARRQRDLQPTAAAERTAQQSKAIREAATGKTGPAPLTSGLMQPPEASAHVVDGMQGAHDVIKSEERRLWSKDTIRKTALDLPQIVGKVDKTIASMPQRLQQVIENTPDLKGLVEQLRTLQPGATLSDINGIRSELLGLGRTLPRDQATAAGVAKQLAQSVLDGVESNPALRNNTQAWRDYVQARNFTARMWDVFGHQDFQSMLKANRWGNQGVDARTAASNIFGFGKGGGESIPGGINDIGKMLGDVQRQWAALRTSGAASAGAFPPAVAQAARADLLQGARDFITNSLLSFAEHPERDLNGEQKLGLNKISSFIDDNLGWIQRSGLYNADQIGVWKAIRDASVMGARIDNLRGGKGSETYEKLMKDPNWIKVFASPWMFATAAGAGALVGGAFGSFGEAGFAAFFGIGAEGAGVLLLHSLFAMPRARLVAKLNEGINDPEISRFLMSKVSQGGNYVPPSVRRWLRSFVAQEAPGQTRRVDSRVPDTVAPQIAAPAGAF